MDSELPLTLTNLFEEQSQSHICPWKKNKIPLADMFWQISSPRFLFEPSGRAEEELTCSLELAVSLRWQEPCLPRTAVSHSVTD